MDPSKPCWWMPTLVLHLNRAYSLTRSLFQPAGPDTTSFQTPGYIGGNMASAALDPHFSMLHNTSHSRACHC